jgi:hypothetical protein
MPQRRPEAPANAYGRGCGRRDGDGSGGHIIAPHLCRLAPRHETRTLTGPRTQADHDNSLTAKASPAPHKSHQVEHEVSFDTIDQLPDAIQRALKAAGVTLHDQTTERGANGRIPRRRKPS